MLPLNRAQRIGLPLGAVACVAMSMFDPPQGLSESGWRTAALATLMAIWWVTEAIPIPATALLPIVLLPVLGVPLEGSSLQGLDALLATVQMPGGIPVATFAIGKAGAVNAALFAAAILARSDDAVREKLQKFREAQSAAVPERPY